MQVQCDAFQFEGERKKRGRQWKSPRRWKPGIWRAHNDDEDDDDHDIDSNDDHDLDHDDDDHDLDNYDHDLDHDHDDHELDHAHDHNIKPRPQLKDSQFIMSGHFCIFGKFLVVTSHHH